MAPVATESNVHATAPAGHGVNGTSVGTNGVESPSRMAEPIAIVGMACRLPGDVSSPSTFWDLLENGRSGLGEVPPSRFNMEAWHNPTKGHVGTLPFNKGYYLSQSPEHFDSAFFGSTAELDPQQRMLLEVVYEAFESSGVPLESLSGSKTGCYVGNFSLDFEKNIFKEPQFVSGQAILGCGSTTLSNRLSWLFNLKGPSLTLDTACSSSMYALHLACQAIRAGDCSTAVVAAPSVILGPEYHLAIDQIGALSASSMCHAFDASADGYARAEGVNAIYIKKLSDAIRAGDPIRAVVRGTALNHNGKTNGITLPNALQQEQAIRKAYQSGGIPFDSVGYVECHGTGTLVGDPLETSAIANVFSKGRTAEDPLLIGSTKPNVGHNEAASALTSIIKVVMSLENGVVPQTIGVTRLNPKLDLRDGKIKVVTENTPWPESRRKRASINSSGYGGANGHCVIESLSETLIDLPEYTPSPPERAITSQSKFLLPLSAHGDLSLENTLSDIRKVASKYDVRQLAYTLSQRRSKLPNRSFLLAVPSETQTTSILEASLVKGRKQLHKPVIAFAFTGQGSQWAGMGKELSERFHTVRGTFKALDLALSKLDTPPDWTFERILNAENDIIDQVAYSQPLCTAVQVALVDLLRDWGVTPAATIGHSSGEIAAAYAADKLSKEQAIIIAYLRGIAASRCQLKGAMMAVGGSLEVCREHLNGMGLQSKVTIACVNSPESITASGDVDAIDFLSKLLDQLGIFNRRLRTGGIAYHSHHMAEKVGPDYEEMMKKAIIFPEKSKVFKSKDTSKESSVVMISSVTRRPLEGGALDFAYWRKNLESPVLFEEALTNLLSTPVLDGKTPNLVIEIGPHPTLKGPIKQTMSAYIESLGKVAASSSAGNISYDFALQRKRDSVESMLELAGRLFITGYPIDLGSVNGIASANPITDLPTYAWDHSHKHSLMENRTTRELKYSKTPKHDLIGIRVPGANKMEPVWRNLLRLKDVPWIGEHKIRGTVIVPGACYLAMAIEAATQIAEDVYSNFDISNAKFRLRTVSFKSALILPDYDTAADVVLNMKATIGGGDGWQWHEFKICSVLENDKWTEHVVGQVGYHLQGSYDEPPPSVVDDAILDRSTSVNSWYGKELLASYHFGKLFHSLYDVRSNSRTAKASASTRIRIPLDEAMMQNESRYALHPVTIDAMLQLGLVAKCRGRPDRLENLALPTFIEDAIIWPDNGSGENRGNLIGNTWDEGARRAASSLSFIADNGRRLAYVKRLQWTAFDEKVAGATDDKSTRAPYHRLLWKPDIRHMDNNAANTLNRGVHGAAQTYKGRNLRELWSKVETLALLCICDILGQVKESELAVHKETKLDLTPFYDFLVEVRKHAALRDAPATYDSSVLELKGEERKQTIAAMFEELEFVPEVVAVKRLFEPYADFFRGKKSAVGFLFHDDLMPTVYTTGLHQLESLQNLGVMVDLLAHKSPRMRILEIGAGTGSATKTVMKALNLYDTTGNARRYLDYTFTDISPTFFEKAAANLKQYTNITFKALDISKSPDIQGFEYGSYDLIIASNVLHATPNINDTVERCYKLLKPGGQLLLNEATEITTHHNHLISWLIYGPLSGFWDSGRPNGPFMSLEEWDVIFKDGGFSGNDIVFKDYPGLLGTNSVVLTTKVASSSISAVPQVVLLYGPTQKAEAEKIAATFQESEGQIIHTSLAECASAVHYKEGDSKPRYIVLEELERPLLSNITEAEFKGMQHMVNTASKILWLTAGDLLNGTVPEMAMVQGFSKVIMNEDTSRNIRFATLDFDEATRKNCALLASLTAKLDLQLRDSSLLVQDLDFRVQDGIVHVSRLVPDLDLNHKFVADNDEQGRDVLFQPGEINWQSEMGTFGLPETARFRASPSAQTALGPDEVEIISHSVGMNFKDYMISMGQFESAVRSFGCAGIVSRVGSAVKEFVPGDRAMSCQSGWYDTRLRSPSYLCRKIGENDKFDDMATLGVVYCTAIYGMQYMAKLEEGESVLIQSAAGGLGIAAIQIARKLGAEIYCTVGTEEKKLYLMEQFGIPEDHILWSRSPKFESELMRRTGGKGIDVILSTASGSMFYESVNCLAPCGRFIDVGRGDVGRKGKLDLQNLEESTSVFSFDIVYVFENKPKVAKRVLDTMMDLLHEGAIAPIPIAKTFHITEMEDAIRFFGKAKHIGKVILDYGPSDTKVKLMGETKPYSFDENSSYLLVGCQSGIGQGLASYMVDRGARKLTFLSRSGEDKQEAASLKADLQRQGVEVNFVRGDATKKEDVERAVTISEKSGPLRGVVGMQMVLEDSFFRSMSVDQFTAAVGPKHHGSWNLHEVLVDRNIAVDFFLLTSSTIAYTGNMAQSNYAAGCTYQNALGRLRRQMGLPATTLSLGPISGGSGTLANRPELIDHLARVGLQVTSEEDFLHHCINAIEFNATDSEEASVNGCIMTGLEPGRIITTTGKNIDAVRKNFEADARSTILLTALEAEVNASSITDGKTKEVEDAGISAVPEEEDDAIPYLTHKVVGRLSGILFTSADSIDPEIALAGHGLDSMSGAELLAWLSLQYKVELSFLQILTPDFTPLKLAGIIWARVVKERESTKDKEA